MDSIISASSPVNNSISSSSILAVRMSPGMSIMEISQCSVALIDVVMSTESVAAVGDVAIFLLFLLHCSIPLAYMRPLICPMRFSLRNISMRSATACCSVINDFFFTGLKVSLL